MISGIEKKEASERYAKKINKIVFPILIIFCLIVFFVVPVSKTEYEDTLIIENIITGRVKVYELKRDEGSDGFYCTLKISCRNCPKMRGGDLLVPYEFLGDTFVFVPLSSLEDKAVSKEEEVVGYWDCLKMYFLEGFMGRFY